MTVSELLKNLYVWEQAGFGDLKVRIGTSTKLIEGNAITYHDIDIETSASIEIFFITEPEQKIKPETHTHYT